MPNLAGILDQRSEPTDIPAALGRLARSLAVDGIAYQRCSWHDECFGAVNLIGTHAGDPDQPAVSADSRHVLFLDGEIYNHRQLRQRVLRDVPNADVSSESRLCLALFEQYGDVFAVRLNGQFNIVVYDTASRTVKVFNDRLAYRPLYYLYANGLLLFALEKKAIFAACDRTPSIDPQGVLEFFTFGHNLADRTVFNDIQPMPQGAMLEAGADGVRVHAYWRPAYGSAGGPVGLRESAREFGRRLCAAMAIRADRPRRHGILLSGGLDSRAVAGALAATRQDITAFTFGNDASRELAYARQMADRLGFAHRQLVYSGVSFSDALPRIVWRTECAIPFNQTPSTEQHRHIRPHADALFNGHFGDALSGGHLLPHQFLARSTDRLVKHILAKRTLMRLPGLRRVFRKDFLDRAYPEMFDAIRHTLASLSEDRSPFLYNLWDMTVRQRRFTFSSPSVDRYALEQITPFTDNDVVDWALSLPLRFLVGQRAYKRMIVSTFPSIADVPWTRTGRRVPTSLLCDMARQGSMFAWRRLRRVMPPKPPAESAAPSPWALRDPRLRERLERYIASEAFLDEAFDRSLLQHMIVQHYEKGENFATPIAALLTLAESVHLFIEGTPESPPPEVRPVLAEPPAADTGTGQG